MDLLRPGIGRLLAPVRCGGCGDALPGGAASRPWCAHCWLRCGALVGPWPAAPGGCSGWSAAAYRGPVRRAVLAGKTGAPAALVALLLDRLPPGLVASGAQVTWVPGHPLRTITAPDSGRALAAAIAQGADGAELAALLGRSPLGRRQARRTSEDRRSGAHRLGLRVTGTPKGAVVLVDDVRTTGATLDHAARLLCEAGATSVLAVTVAAAAAELER